MREEPKQGTITFFPNLDGQPGAPPCYQKGAARIVQRDGGWDLERWHPDPGGFWSGDESHYSFEDATCWSFEDAMGWLVRQGDAPKSEEKPLPPMDVVGYFARLRNVGYDVIWRHEDLAQFIPAGTRSSSFDDFERGWDERDAEIMDETAANDEHVADLVHDLMSWRSEQ